MERTVACQALDKQPVEILSSSQLARALSSDAGQGG